MEAIASLFAHRIFDPAMSTSRCMQTRSPLYRLRLTVTLAQNGFFTSNGLEFDQSLKSALRNSPKHVDSLRILFVDRRAQFGDFSLEEFFWLNCSRLLDDRSELSLISDLSGRLDAVFFAHGGPHGFLPRYEMLFDATKTEQKLKS